MKKPVKIKLPMYLSNDTYLDMVDASDVIIATINTHHNLVKDGEFMVEACNNYNKCMELLIKAYNELTACSNDDNLKVQICEYIQNNR
jgi:hypothetical protein